MGPSGSEAGEGLRNALRPALSRAPLTPACARRRLSPAGAAGVLYASLCHSMKPPPPPPTCPSCGSGRKCCPQPRRRKRGHMREPPPSGNSLCEYGINAKRALETTRSVWIFLAQGRLTAKAPVFKGWKSLDFLGFSRPKSSLFNGLHGIFAERNFARPFAAAAALKGRANCLGHADAQDCSWDELNSFSDFLQSNAGACRKRRLSTTSPNGTAGRYGGRRLRERARRRRSGRGSAERRRPKERSLSRRERGRGEGTEAQPNGNRSSARMRERTESSSSQTSAFVKRMSRTP